jgi:chromosome segregation and condensation protein ScpB
MRPLTKLEAGVLMAVACFQPVTRGSFPRCSAGDLARPDRRAPAGGADRRGAAQPEARRALRLLTTDKFLLEFGFESLRDMPDLEALKDATLMGAEAPPDAAR